MTSTSSVTYSATSCGVVSLTGWEGLEARASILEDLPDRTALPATHLSALLQGSLKESIPPSQVWLHMQCPSAGDPKSSIHMNPVENAGNATKRSLAHVTERGLQG